MGSTGWETNDGIAAAQAGQLEDIQHIMLREEQSNLPNASLAGSLNAKLSGQSGVLKCSQGTEGTHGKPNMLIHHGTCSYN